MPSQYYFDELDASSFQRLINALLVRRYGEGIRLLPLRGKDGGRDAETPINTCYFTVDIPVNDDRGSSSIKSGKYLFQVKHHRMSDHPPTSSRSAVIQDFANELRDNVLPRSGEDRVNFFFLITNVSSSRDAFEKVDEKRQELLGAYSDLHAEVLWQDHVTAWLDQAAPLWSAFPEIFAGRTVPMLGQIAGSPSQGLPLAIKLALRSQFERDAVIRFRQVNLEKRLSRLFVDLDAIIVGQEDLTFSPDLHPEQIQLFSTFDQAAFYSHLTSKGILRTLLGNDYRKHTKIILEGGPGQGKSTVTQMLAQVYRSLLLDEATEYLPYTTSVTVCLPLRVELRVFAEWLGNTERSVEQYLAETLTRDSGGIAVTVGDIHLLAQRQEVLLVFDGLDEVGSDSLRDRVVQKIVESIARFDSTNETGLRAIVASRPPAVAGRMDSLSGFRRIALQPLSDSRIDTYVKKWTEVICSDSQEEERVAGSFTKRKKEDHVAALAKNPMQLSVLLHFIRLKGEAFPDRRAELYREYFKTVIDRDVEKSPDLRRNRDDIEMLHEVIGFAIQSRAERDRTAARLSRPALLKLVSGWLKHEDRRADIGEDLFKIGEERLGLIVALSGEGATTQYGFEIQPVREYFAAAFINDKCEADAHELFDLMIRRTFWKEVARFLAGLRRANERADLLNRARQLDTEPDEGWRSEGLAIVHQLIQEGVLTSPGSVHRESLSFLLSVIDPLQNKAKLEPSSLVAELPKMIRGCDSEQPKRQLRAVLAKSKALDDQRDLRRLWTVCCQNLPLQELIQFTREFCGPKELQPMLKVRWPSEAGISIVTELDAAGELAQIPLELLTRELYLAGSLDPKVRCLSSTPKAHQLLLEQLAFRGIVHDPTDWLDSPFAVWQLGAHLQRVGQGVREHKRTGVPSNLSTDYSGLPDELSGPVQKIFELVRDASIADGAEWKRASAQLLSGLAESIRQGGFISLLAIRCAATLMTYAADVRVMMERDGMYWEERRSAPAITRTRAWRDLKRAIVPYFRAATVEVADRLGRVSTPYLVARGFYRSLPSHMEYGGSIVPILSLLGEENAQKRSGAYEWLLRVPIQQYWLRDFISSGTVGAVLRVLSESPLEWSGMQLPITEKQVGYITAAIRRADGPHFFLGAIFALRRAKMWRHVSEQLLSELASKDSRSRGHCELLFERNEFPPTSAPAALISVAKRIVAGEIKTSSSVSSAAAGFLAGRSNLKLAPLRNCNAFPQWDGFVSSA